MGASYYDVLLPVCAPQAGLREVVAGIALPPPVLGSVRVPAGRIVLGLVSDNTRLSGMFAANWAAAGTGRQPDATLYALSRPAGAYGLDDRWDRARWWSRDHKMMLVEERRYRQLIDRTTISWINNCGTPETLVDNFISAIMK